MSHWFQIHLRNYDDIPQVKDSGFNVAPGYQTLAPLDYLTVYHTTAHIVRTI